MARTSVKERRAKRIKKEEEERDEQEEKPEGMFKVTRGAKKADPYIKMMVYGEYGAGKTVLAASAVDVKRMRDVLFINAEAGTRSIRESGVVEREDDIDFVPVSSYPEFAKVHKFLLAHCRAREDGDDELIERINEKFGADKDRRYRTVVVDSLSEIDNANFNRLLGVNQTDLMRDPSKPEWDHYSKNASSMTAILTEFRKLQMNVIMTAPSEVRETKQKGVSSTYPLMVGSSREKVKGYFDIVGFIEELDLGEVDDDEEDEKPSKKKKRKVSSRNEDDDWEVSRRLWLRKRDGVYAKSRVTPDSLKFIDNPTMSTIEEYIK